MSRFRAWRALPLGLPLLLASQLLVPPASAATTSAGAATQQVIVELKAQPSDGPDRAHAKARATEVADAEAPLLQQLARQHARATALHLLPEVAATVTADEAAALAADPSVAAVIPDETVRLAKPAPVEAPLAPAAAPKPGGGAAQACGTPGAPAQDEYLSTMHVGSSAAQPGTARSLGFDGTGVTVAYIADGADPTNPDFTRPDGSSVFTDIQSFVGQATSPPTGLAESFIDSSAIAAQGRQTYDVSGFASTAQPGCAVRVQGVAPGANLVGLVAGNAELFTTSAIVEAIDYATYVDRVDVLSESFGANPFPDQPTADIISQADSTAVAAGITVVLSSGDAGPSNTIGSPASNPDVIATGASTTYQLYSQIGYGGTTIPGITGYRSDEISALSSGGVDQAGRTLDLVAPGDLNWSLCNTDLTRFPQCTNLKRQPTPVVDGGGTSQSAPLTAGAAALVIQAYRQAHSGATPTPAQVKAILTSTATDLGAPADEQGAGEVDAYRAVRAAVAAPGAVQVGPSQLDAVGQPGSRQTLTETVTNTGTATETVQASTRTLGAPTTPLQGNVTFDSSTPTFSDYTNRTNHYVEYPVDVPAGTALLRADSAYPGPAIGKLALLDPEGRLAGYSLPQGTGEHTAVEADSPEAGRWTVVVFARLPASGGTNGPIAYRAQLFPAAPFGTVSPASLTLAPGQSSAVTLTTPAPGGPGDFDGSLVLSSSTGGADRVSTVPVVVRALAPPPGPHGTFTGTLVGGNGRADSAPTGQSAFYEFDVPSGLDQLNAEITLPSNDTTSTFLATLVDPRTGLAAATATNSQIAGGDSTVLGGDTLTTVPGAALHVLAPAAGRWTLAVSFYDDVNGVTVTEPYTVSLTMNQTKAEVSKLPQGMLSPGEQRTATVKVTNTGAEPVEYFVDPRLTTSVPVTLAGTPSNTSTVPLANPLDAPVFAVPSHTSSVTVSQTGSSPSTFDFAGYTGDPDLYASPGPSSGTSALSFTPAAGPVPPGFYILTPNTYGPDGATSTQPFDVTDTVTALTQAFDASATSTTGDVWRMATDPHARFAPVTAQPGQTVTIPVTITAGSTSGSTVQGVLYVATATTGLNGPYTPYASAPIATDVAAFPYSYGIK